MRKNILVFITALGIMLSPATITSAQEQAEQIKQEEFAVELIRTMKLEGWLPTAATELDCVELLRRIGISPLKGWDPKAYLSQEDYLVIVAQTQGREHLIYERAIAVDGKNIEIVNRKWEEAYKATNQWPPLGTLLKDPKYFPNGAPESPYGLGYEDANEDHKVDSHLLPAAGLMKLRQMLTTKNF